MFSKYCQVLLVDEIQNCSFGCGYDANVNIMALYGQMWLIRLRYRCKTRKPLYCVCSCGLQFKTMLSNTKHATRKHLTYLSFESFLTNMENTFLHYILLIGNGCNVLFNKHGSSNGYCC
jgi:hypothetical protein